MTLTTNRDLYRAVGALCRAQAANRRPLETFLLALLAAAEPLRGRAGLSPDEVHSLLRSGFDDVPAPFDPAWRHTTHDERADGFDGWRARLIRQLVDLREMAESGALRHPQRELGIDAPRGSRWYNFDPATYLECGVEGTFGGWEPGDEDSGRAFVPGLVAVMDKRGVLGSANPEDIDRPLVDLSLVEWSDLKSLLGDGQWYE